MIIFRYKLSWIVYASFKKALKRLLGKKVTDGRKVILEICGLTKHYGGVKALNDADFKMYAGKHIAIVGDNGAGNSTFICNITGGEQRISGEVFVDGGPVNFKAPNDAWGYGMETVYRNLALADYLNVPENIFLGREDVYFEFSLENDGV